MFKTPTTCFEPSYFWTSRSSFFPTRVHIICSLGCDLFPCSSVRCRVKLSGPYSTERSWQDLDLSQKATLGLFLATTLSRKRLAFMGRLSRRVLQCMCLRRLLASLESRRRRSCRTMPLKASQTLCCMAAEVSINLQSNTAAQARPSENKEAVLNKKRISSIPHKQTMIASPHH